MNEGGRDSWVGKSSASQAEDSGSNPGRHLTLVHPMHDWEGKRLPAVKFILLQLAWLIGAQWFFCKKKHTKTNKLFLVYMIGV